MLKLAQRGIGSNRTYRSAGIARAHDEEAQARGLLEKGLAAADLDEEVLSRLAGSDVRKVALANLLLERTVARQSWIAEHLVMRSAANVSQQVRRYRLSKPQLPRKLKTYLSAVKIC
jgi:putative transposase